MHSATSVMTSNNRRTFASRLVPIQKISSAVLPVKALSRATPSSKRPRSPEPPADTTTVQTSSKRARGSAIISAAVRDQVKEQKRAEREEEFRTKYARAFPSWVFYFDFENLNPEGIVARQSLESKVSQLGGRIECFFSNEITHLISNQTLPADSAGADKENAKPRATRHTSALKGTVKLHTRATDAHLISKALEFGMKIWSTTKLESILDRCMGAVTSLNAVFSRAGASTAMSVVSNQRSLSHLLHNERILGTTERDPSQKRHDFRYFSRSSCFVLVEDILQELATIAALEYPLSKSRDGTMTGAWPVLYCHPRSRGPFVEFDEKERRRWEKSQRCEPENKDERQTGRAQMRRQGGQTRESRGSLPTRRAGDLRRSLSMNHIHRRTSKSNSRLGLVDLDADTKDPSESANVSRYLASGTGGMYMAASGNSVCITSTAGTTSTAPSCSFSNLQLPASLRGRIQQQVITSRKFPAIAHDAIRIRNMAPPMGVPPVLKKSQSTNTLRLPKRDEGSKPGYCESCRMKFDDFKAHINGRKHRKFAINDANFLQLDFVLACVQRRTSDEVEAEKREREAKCLHRMSDFSIHGEETVSSAHGPTSSKPGNTGISSGVWDQEKGLGCGHDSDLDNLSPKRLLAL